MHTPDYGGRVDAIGGVEGEDIAFFPVPEGFETFSEVEGCGADLRVGVGTGGIWVCVDYCFIDTSVFCSCCLRD